PIIQLGCRKINTENLRKGHNIDDPDDSQTKKVYGHWWQFTNIYGSCAGGSLVYVDKVSIGPFSATQNIQVATFLTGKYANESAIDGYMGLAASALNTAKPRAQKTWFQNIGSQLAEPIIAMSLRRDQPGAYDFGWTDSKKHTGAITWFNATKGRPLVAS